MKTKVSLLLVVVLAAISAVAANPATSFKLDSPKALRGTLQDETETPIPDTEIQLLDAHKKLIKSVKSDAKGQYDFGTLAPGRYHVRLKSDQWTTKPDVACTGDACLIAPLFRDKNEKQNPISF